MANKTKTFRFDNKLLISAEKLAAKENRSLNNWLEWLMKKEIEANKTKK